MPSYDQYNNSAPREHDYASRLRQLQTAQKASQAKQAGVEMLKKEVKKRVWIWIAGILAGIFLNPVTWMIIGILIVIALVVAIIVKIPGFEIIQKFL